MALAPDAQQMPGVGPRPCLRGLGLLFWKVVLAVGHSGAPVQSSCQAVAEFLLASPTLPSRTVISCVCHAGGEGTVGGGSPSEARAACRAPTPSGPQTPVCSSLSECIPSTHNSLGTDCGLAVGQCLCTAPQKSKAIGMTRCLLAGPPSELLL